MRLFNKLNVTCPAFKILFLGSIQSKLKRSIYRRRNNIQYLVFLKFFTIFNVVHIDLWMSVKFETFQSCNGFLAASSRNAKMVTYQLPQKSNRLRKREFERRVIPYCFSSRSRILRKSNYDDSSHRVLRSNSKILQIFPIRTNFVVLGSCIVDGSR